MPTEFRHIIFSEDETIAAIVEFQRRSGNVLPAGTVAQCVLTAEPDIRVDLEIEPDGESESQWFAFSRDDLATALIMYCIDHRIPMPIKSTKFLQMFGSSVGLVITKNVSLAPITRATQG